MNLEKLKEMLANGEITQEEFDAKVKELEENKEENKEEKGLTQEDILKMIQSETDKVRTKYTQDLSILKEENEKLKKEKMTDKEKQEYEIQQRDKLLAEREIEISKREREIVKRDVLVELELDHSLKDLLVGENEEEIRERAKLLKTTIDKQIAELRKEELKGKGVRDLNLGSGNGGGITREQFLKMGYKEKIELKLENEELYNSLNN